MDEKVLVKRVLRAMRSGDERELRYRFGLLVRFYRQRVLI